MRECKLLHIRYNLFAGIEMLSLSVYESIANKFLHGGNRPPIWGRGRARGRVWHHAKVLHIRSNLFAGTETLSLSVNEPIARQILSGGTVPPNLGEGPS